MAGIVSLLREEAWIYEAEPDWVVNLTRLGPLPRPLTLSLLALFSSQDALVHALGKGDAEVKGGWQGSSGL